MARFCHPTDLIRHLFLCILLLVLCGCAATSTTVVDEEVVTNSKPMYLYTTLLINDFELQRSLYTDATPAKMNKREQLYATLPSLLSDHIERYVTSDRIYKSVLRKGKPDGATVVLSGRFTRVGRFKISVTASLRDGASGQEVAFFRQTLWDVVDTTDTVNQLGREVARFINRIQYK